MMQILYRTVFRAAWTPNRSTIVFFRSIRKQAAKPVGLSRVQTTPELGVVRGFKTGVNLLQKNKHHLRRRAQNVFKEKETVKARVIHVDRLGMGIAAAATLCSFAVLCLKLSADPNRYSPLWPKYVQERIHSTCAYIGGTIFIASRIAVAAFRSPAVMKFMICMVSIFGTYIYTAGVGKMVRMIPWQPDKVVLKHMTWAVCSVLLGVAWAATRRYPVLLETVTITIFAGAGLTVVILCAPSKAFIHELGPLAMSLGVAIGTALVCLVPPVASSWESRAASAIPNVRSTQVRCAQIASLIIFLGLTLIRVNMMIEHAETLPPDQTYDPVNAAMSVLLPD